MDIRAPFTAAPPVKSMINISIYHDNIHFLILVIKIATVIMATIAKIDSGLAKFTVQPNWALRLGGKIRLSSLLK